MRRCATGGRHTTDCQKGLPIKPAVLPPFKRLTAPHLLATPTRPRTEHAPPARCAHQQRMLQAPALTLARHALGTTLPSSAHSGAHSVELHQRQRLSSAAAWQRCWHSAWPAGSLLHSTAAFISTPSHCGGRQDERKEGKGSGHSRRGPAQGRRRGWSMCTAAGATALHVPCSPGPDPTPPPSHPHRPLAWVRPPTAFPPASSRQARGRPGTLQEPRSPLPSPLPGRCSGSPCRRQHTPGCTHLGHTARRPRTAGKSRTVQALCRCVEFY